MRHCRCIISNFSTFLLNQLFSLNFKSAKRAVKTYNVKGSRYLMIDGESKPI